MLTQSSFRKQEAAQPLKLPEGNLFRRMLAAKAVASVRRAWIGDVAQTIWPNDRELSSLIAARSASSPAMTTVAGWAAELSQKLVADTVEALGAASAAAEIMQECLLLDWSGHGIISVPAFVATANTASFVAEGNPVPVHQFTDTAQPILPHKVCSISALTREMMESSNAERLIGDALIRSSGLAIDAAFFDSNAASPARPAGIRNGVSTLPPSSNTDSFGVFAEDLSTVIGAVGAVGGNGPFFLVGSAGRIASASVRYLSGDDSIRMIISSNVGNDLIAIAPQAIAAALSPDPEVETVNAGTLVMDDSAPGAAGTMGPERSLFQTETLAIKARWPVSWTVRDPRGVAWVTPTWK